MMTLQELRYIVAVAKYRHFSKAAEACFISQPSLSVAIQKLEDRLDVKIFERYKSKVLLTDVGEKIVAQAKQVLQSADQIKLIANQTKNPLAATVKLGAIFTVAPYILPYLVSKLNKLAPDLRLQLSENFTEKLRDQLLEGEIDMALLAEPFEDSAITKLALFEESFVVLLPASHSLAKKKVIESKQLVNENILLLGQGHCLRDHVLSVCPHCYVDQPKGKDGVRATTFEGTSLETIRHMVASGMGITVLPATAATLPSYLKQTLVAVPLKSTQAKRKIVLASRKQFARSEVMTCIKQALQQSVLKNNELIRFV
jgi:LysR family transcriptional regulator, hydrogen peroxide-inducible genes activator